MRKTGRHTFVIDGNYFLFRTLYVLPRKSKKTEMLATDEDATVFMRKLATDFAYQIRLFEGLIDKVVWTIDSRSWRKDFIQKQNIKVIVNKTVQLTGQTFQSYRRIYTITY